MNYPKLHIGFDFIILVCVLYLFDRQNMLLPTLTAAFLHELGHLAMIALCGSSVSEIRLSAFGACITIDDMALSYKKECLVALGGPLIGFCAAAVFSVCGQWVFAGLNFTLSLFNLLPIAPLDGGKMLRAVLCCFCSVTFADNFLSVIGITVGFLLAGACLLLSASAQCTVSAILFCAFLLCTVLRN